MKSPIYEKIEGASGFELAPQLLAKLDDFDGENMKVDNKIQGRRKV